MFNPDPKIQLVPIPGFKPCIVVDNFVQNPQALVELALRERHNFANAAKNAFPGRELRMPDGFSALLNDFFIQHVRKQLGIRRTLSLFSRLSMITLQPHELAPNQRVCHQDQITDIPNLCFSALVLYLFKNPALGGTSFYAPKISPAEVNRLYSPTSVIAEHDHQNYITESSAHFELIRTIPAVWNRAIFYDSGIFHSGHITDPGLLSADPAAGRLTLNGFFTCQKAAG